MALMRTGLPGVHGLAQDPMMRRVGMLKIKRVTVLNDASWFDGGERECLCENLEAPSLHQRFIENVAIEEDNRTVGLYRPSSNVDHIVHTLDEGNLDVRMFPTLFGEDLDSVVVILVYGSTTAVVSIYFAEQNDGRSTRCFVLAGHLQLIPRHRLEIHRP